MEASMKEHRNISSIRIIAPVPKFGIQMPLAVSPTGYRELNRLYPSARRDVFREAFLAGGDEDTILRSEHLRSRASLRVGHISICACDANRYFWSTSAAARS